LTFLDFFCVVSINREKNAFNRHFNWLIPPAKQNCQAKLTGRRWGMNGCPLARQAIKHIAGQIPGSKAAKPQNAAGTVSFWRKET
jgi:hypothetical protein